jgi:DNA-directed RNA polymerase sigma subunit (sigma70/sigma32)
MLRSPEAKLMSQIFDEWFEDSNLHQVFAGETLRAAIYKQLDQLDGLSAPAFRKRAKRIIELRAGFEGGRSRTLEEAGKEFGISKERVRQIEAKVLRILRHPKYATKLRLFIKEQNHA